MPIASNSYVRSTGGSDSVERTIMEGRTPTQVVSDLATALNSAGYMLGSADLSDVDDVATARSNLGLGTAALSDDTDFQPASSALTALAATSPGATGLDLVEAATVGEAVELLAPLVAILTPGANVATDAVGRRVFTLEIDQNSTLDDPTNLTAGQTYKWIVTQDATGGWTLAYGAMFLWPGGVAPTLSAGIGAVDVITALFDGTNLFATITQDFS